MKSADNKLNEGEKHQDDKRDNPIGGEQTPVSPLINPPPPPPVYGGPKGGDPKRH